MTPKERQMAAGAYMVGCLFIIAGTALSFGPGWGLIVLGISIIIPAIFGKSTK